MNALARCFLGAKKGFAAPLTAFLLFVVALCWTASPAFAVDNLGLLELEHDANIRAGVLSEDNIPNPAIAPGDDWKELYKNFIDSVPIGNTVAYIFLEDGTVKFNGVDRIFTKSKDIEDIPDWEHKADFNTPPKDNIFNAMAAAYFDSGDLVVYFAADRISNHGSAQLGFWFIADKVDTIKTGPDAGKFEGEHSIGDLLILANFVKVKGQEIADIRVYEWNPASPAAVNNLVLLNSLPLTPDEGRCGIGHLSAGNACATSNETAEGPFEWRYTFAPKTGVVIDNYPENRLFFEGGVNLTDLFAALGRTVPCFSTFLAETRSSQEPTADLKDLAFGTFEICSVKLSKECGLTGISTGAKLFDATGTITVTNDGPIAYPANSFAIVTDKPVPGSDDVMVVSYAEFDELNPIIDSTGTDGDGNLFVKIDIGGLAPDVSKSVNVVFASNVNGFDNDAMVLVTDDLGFEVGDMEVDGDINVPGDEPASCNPLELNPMLALDKQCEVKLINDSGMVAVQVGYDGRVCNTGEIPMSVKVVDIQDEGAVEVVLAASQFLDAPTSCESDADCTNACTGGLCLDDTNGILGQPICVDYSDQTYKPTILPSEAGAYTDSLLVTPLLDPLLAELFDVTTQEELELIPGLGPDTEPATCLVCPPPAP